MKKTSLAALLCYATAWALPQGGQVIQGNIQMTQPSSNILQILQSSPTGIINWGSFNIDAQQLVQFLQTNSAAAVLNRVVGQEPSQILGQLQANGRVLLINPNGILFGPGSVVDTGSFLASTLSITDQDFLQGRYNLQWDPNSPMRAVVNQGQIKVADGGFLALVSPVVENQGLLVAQGGQVVLGATRQASLTVDARGLLTVVIPDGFRGRSSGPAETVLLTHNQMSDALSHVVTLSNQAGAIVETPQGIRLAGAEGILINQGQIQAKEVRLDSSQATLLDSNGAVSGEDLRILSAGSAVSMGVLRADFVELSAPHVGLTRAPELSKGGTLLLDPDNIHITNSGIGPPVTLATSPGMDVDVDAAALNVTGGGPVILQADRSIFFDVPVNIDQPVQLQLTATRDIIMNAGTSLNMTDSSAVFQATAGGDMILRDVTVPTTHASAGGTVFIEGGTFGQAGHPTLLDIAGASVSFQAGSITNVVGQRVDMPVKSTSGDILVVTGSQLNLQGVTGNNSTLESNQRTSIESNARISASGPSTLNVTAGTFIQMDQGSSITATDPASVLKLTAGNATDMFNLNVPTIHSTSGQFARFDGGTFGVAGSPTLVNVSGPFVRVGGGSTSDVLGTDVNVTISTLGSTGQDVGLEGNSRLNVLGTTSNNITLTAPGAAVFTDSGSSLVTSNVLSHVLVDGGTLNMLLTSQISSPNPASSLTVQATGAAVLAGVQVPTIQVHSGDFTSFLGGNLGVAGTPTLVDVTGKQVRVSNGAPVNVNGTDVNVTFNTLGNPSNDIGLENGARFNLQGSNSNNVTMTAPGATVFFDPNTSLVTSNALSHVQISGGDLNMNPGSRISEPNPNSTLNVQTTGQLTVAGTEVSTVNLDSGTFERFNGGTMGVAGAPTLLNVTSQGGMTSSGTVTNVVGSNVNVTWSNTLPDGTLQLGDNSQLNARGTLSNNVTLTGNSGNVTLSPGSNLTTSSVLSHVNIAGQSLTMGAGSRVSAPDPASSMTLASGISSQLSRVETGGNLTVVAGGGGVNITDQLSGNQINLQTPGRLLDSRGDGAPAIMAGSLLNVTAANISGPVNVPEAGLVSGLAFATGSGAQVRFNVTGTNVSNQHNRAANLFYAYPQSSDVQITNPSGDVLLYNETAPPRTAEIPSNALTAAQLHELQSDTAQAQVQLSSLYSVADLPALNDILLLEYQNPGLIQEYSIGYMTSAVIERVVLSPEDAARQLNRRDKERLARPDVILIAGNDEDEELLYWRRLIQGFILWEDE
jgi:filamentous hemagglutinin family protein